MLAQLAIAAPIDPNQLPRVDWVFQSTNFKATNFAYTPFFIEGSQFTSYSAGYGGLAGNGFLRFMTDLFANSTVSETRIINAGPNLAHYNYFRAPRVAKNGSELWMLVEMSGCYTGCDSVQYPNRLAVYHSLNDGVHWTFLDFASVDGVKYVSKWFGHTGLVYNPKGSSKLDLVHLAKNRFVTIGENRDIFVSADGINYKSIPMNHPFANDRLVFASLARTPFGFHLVTCANWSDLFYTTTVRHLFSKDLRNWYPIESNSFLKNPNFYKGIHLSYDEKAKKLWALSPCGSVEGCSFLAWVEPKDYLDEKLKSPKPNPTAVGEYIYTNGRSAMIVDQQNSASTDYFRVRFSDGTFQSGLTRSAFTFPLLGYKRQGCVPNNPNELCVGDTIYNGQNLATVMGYVDTDSKNIKYAIKYITVGINGIIDTGFTRVMLRSP